MADREEEGATESQQQSASAHEGEHQHTADDHGAHGEEEGSQGPDDDITGVDDNHEREVEGEERTGEDRQEQTTGGQGKEHGEEDDSGSGEEGKEGEKYHVPRHGEQRIADSLSALDNRKSKGIEHTTAVRVNADEEENKRRIQEEERRQDRIWRLQEEAVGSGKANAAVEMRWNDLKEYNMPQELNEELESQKEACARIISSKDQLIQEFKAELKSKDEEYVKAIKNHTSNIDELIERMRAQYNDLRDAYENELDQVEDAFKREHSELLEAQRKEIDALMEERRQMETRLVEERMERERKYQEELDDMQSRDAEDYNKLKIKLETDVQVLEQQLELMRSTYLLNTEKLEYNYRVLTEKDNENEIAENQQKAKLKRLDAALTKIMNEYRTADKKFRQRNNQLTREYERITAQYRDLQYKFSHFEAADAVKFKEVWDMHEKDASVLVDRLLAADRVIHEQILGWEWTPPENPLQQKPATDPSRGASEHLESRREQSVGGTETETAADAEHVLYGCDQETLEKAQELGINTAAIVLMMPLFASSVEEENISRLGSRYTPHKLARIRVVVGKILDECSFVLDSKALERVEECQDENYKNVVRADALLKSINVTTEAEMNQLVDYFFPSEQDEEHGESRENREDSKNLAEMSAADAEASLESQAHQECEVSPGKVVECLTKFAHDRDVARREAAASKDPFGTTAGGGDDDLLQKLKGPSQDEKSGTGQDVEKRVQREEIEHWNKVANTIPPRTIRVWKALEKSLTKYNNLLRTRSKTMQEVDSLRQENTELRELLQQYMSSKVNEELQVPPGQTMKLGRK
eukprot:gb/GECG01007976.1/.p1 GENE.gb/GECG01007976.1/~~gb/GECG01007976.1/.p1  ORF type:complete len:816 (+),score=191.96 gb/GECG01007976.1/:1-2448(+)